MRHRVVRSRWTLTGLAVVVALALAALAAPLLAPGDPYHGQLAAALQAPSRAFPLGTDAQGRDRSEEHTSELQSQSNLVCRLLLEKKKKHRIVATEYVGRRGEAPFVSDSVLPLADVEAPYWRGSADHLDADRVRSQIVLPR